MAEQGYVLDIDTKFIQNLERADKALRQSVESANNLTEKFTQMVNSSSDYSLGVQNLLNVINNLKGVKIDPATGLLKIGTEARDTAEAVELLKERTKGLTERWSDLYKEIGKRKKGPAAMQITSEKDLTNINALKTAISNINEILSEASGRRRIGEKTQQQLIEQRKLYSDLLKEVQMTDSQRLKSEIDVTNGVIKEANKRTEAVIREKKREVEEALKLARTADIRSPFQVSNATAAIATARQGLDPNINAEQAQIQALDQALEKLQKRYNDVYGDEKEADKQYKYAMALAASAESAEELNTALDAIRNVQGSFNNSTAEGLTKVTALAREEKRLTDLIKLKNGELTNEQKANVAAAIEYANVAEGALQLSIALSKLRSAAKGISPDTEEGRAALNKLNQTMDVVKGKMNEGKGATDGFKSSLDGIGAKIKTAFGLGAIKKFVAQIIKTHGEFEKINASLRVLIGNTAKAEMLWAKITQLALKSPFTVQELATATKQMAAYQIETDKLYQSTKMLADISAGLGVEMSRLILAYGQVKAANFLRGTELRQFSEAGIDMLGQLSAYFSELEGRVVSTAEVFDMISERKVVFEDVDAVLHRITSQGGMFYEMQERQAKTVAGQISNLKDSIQLMFHEIGESSHGVITTVLKVFRTLIENWERWVPTIVAAASGFLIVKTAGLACAVLGPVFKSISLSVRAFKESVNGASRALKILQLTSPLGWIKLIVTALTTAIGVMSAFSETTKDLAEDINYAAEQLSKVFEEESAAVQRAGDAIIAYTEAISKNRKVIDDSTKSEKERIKASNAVDESLAYRSAIISELASRNAELASKIGSVISGERDFIEVEKELRELFDADKTENYVKGRVARELTISDDIVKNYREALENISVSKGTFGGVYKDEIEEAWGDVDKQYAVFLKYVREVDEIKSEIKSITKKAHLDKWYLVTDFEDDLKKLYNRLYGDLKYTDPVEGATQTGRKFTEALAAIYTAGYKAVETWAKANDYSMETIKTASHEVKLSLMSDMEEIMNAAGYSYDTMETLRNRISNLLETTWELPEPPIPEWQKAFDQYMLYVDGFVKENIAQDISVASVLGDVININAQTTKKQAADAIKQKIEEYKDIIAIYQQYSESVPEYARNYNYLDVFTAENYLPILEELLKFFEASASNKDKADSVANGLNNAARAVKELHSSYKDLQGSFNDVDASKLAWKQYGETIEAALKAAGINVDAFKKKVGTLTTSDSVKAAFDELIKLANTADQKTSLRLMRDEFALEMEIEADEKAFNNAMKKAEDLIAGYELGVELDKLHIPHDFAQNFFDIGITELPELRLQVMAQYEGLDIGSEEQEEIEETLKKIDELEAKAQQERLKKYVKFTRDAISERGKILLEEAYTLADIDSSFTLTDTLAKNKGLISEDQLDTLRAAKKTVDDLLSMDLESIKELFTVDGTVTISDEQIANLMKYGKLLAEQRRLATEYVEEQTKQEISELDWSLFKESEVFAQVFNDLENASDSLISTALEKLKEFKSVWANMDVEEFSEVLSMIDKLEAELALATPGKALKSAKSGLKDAMSGKGKYAIEFSENNKEAEGFSPGSLISADDYNAYREALETELALREDIMNTKANDLAIAEGEYNLTIQNANATDDQKKAAKKAMDDAKDALKTAKDNRDQVASTLTLDQQRRDALDGIRTRMEKSVELANDLYDAFKGLADVLLEEDSIGMVFADMGMQMLNTVMNTIMLQIQLDAATASATGFGAAMNSAMGAIGWIVMGVQLLTQALTAIFEATDKNLQNQIDAEGKKVETLKKAYEALEKQLEKAFTASDIGDISREMNDNLEKQIEHTEKMIALEEDKKNADESKIESWKEEVEDMRELMEENMEEAFSSLTSGILDDVLGASRNFVDAWYDAFQETGDGLKGLEESFDDMFASIIKQQASLAIADAYINPLKEKISERLNAEDLELEAGEAAEIKAYWDRIAPIMNDSLKNFFGAFEGLLGTDYGELSGLEKGIQGITEDQAEVLASYWNSCRFMLSNIDMTLTNLASSVLGGGNYYDNIYTELATQTDILRDIREYIGSVIGSNVGNHTGSFIRVYDA